MGTISRRQFLKYGGGGLAAVVVGSQMPWMFKNPAFTAVQTQFLEFRITDAMKEMVTHNSINQALCYFWVYKCVSPSIPVEVPGPTIFATEGDTIQITLTNELDEPHSFSIPGLVDSGPINPGQTIVGSFTVDAAGAYLYFDNLNAPVNRMMGLHGALIVMPAAAPAGHKFTPYKNPTPSVQQLFDDFGSSAHFPGLAWEQGDPATDTPAFRQHIWLTHQASPNLFREVGELPAGEVYPPAQFLNKFLKDPFSATSNNARPQYFTINGQSGHFSHNTHAVTPMHRVGEPVVIHILNAGLWVHSMHLHANHFFVTFINGQVQANPIWVDVFNVHPMDRVDYVVPFMRPPDVPNQRGIGLPDTPLTCLANPLIAGSTPHPTWPPTEEMNMSFPALGTKIGSVEIGVQMSPICYPMHDHSEPTQTSQGGNYNLGLIAGMNFTGDRNTPGGVTTFPNAPHGHPSNTTGEAAPDIPHH